MNFRYRKQQDLICQPPSIAVSSFSSYIDISHLEERDPDGYFPSWYPFQPEYPEIARDSRATHLRRSRESCKAQ
jgi:hypothetical protein